MSRREGTLKLSSNIEPRASAPLDARLVVPTLADLTTSGAFPYPYVGMIVSVQSEGKAYMLTASDSTVSANWKEVGSGSGESIQVTELPTASADELRNIYQYVGESGIYINGYFYECVSDGESTPTYSWEQKDVQPSRYKSINFLTMTGAKYQCITGLKLGGAYLIEIGYNTFIIKVLNNFGDQSQTKYGFEIELLGQNLNDTTNSFYNYPVYFNNFEDNALAPILAIYVSNGERTNIRVTQISGVVNNDFGFGTFYTSTPPAPFKKSTFYSAASMREAIAPLFNDNTSYNVGDIIWKRVNTSANSSRVHDNIELYRCKVAHSGSWSSAHFEKIQLCKDFKPGSKIFPGTLDEWDALPASEKAKYDFIATPDEAVEDIADAVIDGDMRAVTSNAVAQLHNVTYQIISDTELTTTATNYTTYLNRKISDYDYLIVQQYDSSSLRSAAVINLNQFKIKRVILSTLHGANSSSASDYSVSGINVQYVDDTTINAYATGSAMINILKIMGVKITT